jgi:hypothetical protein
MVANSDFILPFTLERVVELTDEQPSPVRLEY